MHRAREGIFLQVKSKQPIGREENNDSEIQESYELSKGNISRLSKKSVRKPKKVYAEIENIPSNIFDIERVRDWDKRI